MAKFPNPHNAPPGKGGDDEFPVFISDRAELQPLSGQRMVVTIHYYPTEHAKAKKKADSLNFLFTSAGAQFLANKMLHALEHQRSVDAQRKDPFKN